MEKISLKTPPHDSGSDISIIHNIKKVYAIIYQVGNKLPKRDKLGIHAKIEYLALEIMRDIIEAALLSKNKKLPSLERTRLSLEVLKHLVRTEYEMKIIAEKMYIRIEHYIIETSKMTNGWIKYLTQTPRP